jgi:pyrroline-5-carboxylate reductase
VLKVKESDIWLTAPTSTQRNNLKTNIVKGTVKESDSSVLGKELISMATNPEIYNTIISDLNAKKRSNDYYKVVENT